VLTDGVLPDGSGITVADCAVERGMLALILTGQALQLPAAELQRHDYILKPIRPPELIRELNRRLGQDGDPA
jgi:CheY-like chemotaxis protein